MRTNETEKFVLSRRMLLRGGALGGAGLAAVWLTGCDAFSTDPAGSDNGGGERPDKGPEAPELAERVDAGDLPPVEERLPAEPLVIEPTAGVGVYGGTWATALQGTEDIAWIRNTICYDGLLRWTPDWAGIEPNIAESYEVSEDGREFTFHLRPEMKWSDGEPFTADDLVFAYEGLILVPEIATAGSAPYIDPNGEAGEVEKVDDHTVRFVFATPNGLFLDRLADPEGFHVTACPMHYLSQFHPDHGSDVEGLVDQEGVSSWFELMERKRSVWDNPDLPVVFAWQVTTPLGSGDRVVAERNPYYWKVDPDGSQLPYINEVTYEMVGDPEVMVVQATNGELDMHARHFNTPANRPVLADSRESGEYEFFNLEVSNMNETVIMLNLNHVDDQLRNLFQNRDFRIGLSHAINREEMIDAVYQQQGEPWQAAPSEMSDFYDEEFAKQYTEYDVDTANEYLDQAGLTERDGEGFRLMPDTGERVSFTVEVALGTPGGDRMPVMELVDEYWEQVGIDMTVNSQDRSVWTAMVQANEHDACVWGGGGGFGDELVNGFYYLPFHLLGSRWAVLWAQWYDSGGESGQEPPQDVREQLAIYDEVRQTVDEDERSELFQQVMDIAREQFYVIGTVIIPESFGIVSNDFHNVPETMALSDHFATPGPTRPEQYYVNAE